MAQFWPARDDFALNDSPTGVTWEYPDRYIPVRMMSSSIPVISEGFTYSGHGGVLCAHGHTPGVLPLGDPSGAAMVSYSGAFTNTLNSIRMLAVVERTQYIQNVEVSADFTLTVDPSVDPDLVTTQVLHGDFIFARVTGGSNAAGFTIDVGNPNGGIDLPSGIFFGHTKAKQAHDTFTLGYTIAGSSTLTFPIANIQVRSIFPGETTDHPYLLFPVRNLRMVCVGNLVTCYATVGTLELQVFNISVPAGLLAAGRCGLSPSLYDLAYPSVSRCTAFQISTADGATVLFRDQFVRPLLNTGHLVPPNITVPFFENGYSLMSAYTGDSYGNDDATAGNQYLHARHLLGDRTNPSIELGSDLLGRVTGLDQEYGWYLSHDRMADPRNQRLAAEFDDHGGTLDYEVGVAVRMTYQGLSGSPFAPMDFRAADTFGPTANELHGRKIGYLLTAKLESTLWSIQMYKYDAGAETRTLLASLPVVRPVGPFALELEVRDSEDGIRPELIARINGVDHTMLTFGSTSSNGNWIVDDGIPVFSGSSSGFFFRALSVTEQDAIVAINYLELLPPTGFPPPISPEDQVSVAMGAETAGISGSLNIPLTWDITVEPCYPAITEDLSTGFRYSFPKYSRVRRIWRVKAKGATYSEADAFTSMIGDKPFTWFRADTGESFSAKLEKGTVSITNDHTAGGSGAVSVSFRLEEVFDAITLNP